MLLQVHKTMLLCRSALLMYHHGQAEGKEETWDCHPGQEFLQTLNEQPSSGCATIDSVAFGRCRERGAPRQNSALKESR